MSLNQYYHTNVGLPINKWFHYLPIYEQWFAPFRNRRIVFLEIGSGQGGSSRMWKHYFGPAATIVSIDIRPECKSFEDEQIAVRIGDQSGESFLQSLLDEFGSPDIVLDDGSHQVAHVNATFDFLYPRQPREALYVVEDTHTAYWPVCGGGLRKPGTFIERMKELIDEINADNPHHATHADQPLPSSEISRITRAVHIYNSMVVLEKGAFSCAHNGSIPFIGDQTRW